ncbi:hypothetical protein [Aliarcobacter skirrowii]|uniref:hypothetical protein n=1 Tax=Aliarcobacter skirrowii TaxID=28200 RepID=UPI0029A2E7D8|nr:hypothetical protein [Aliarcobacter skirrowii]MDX4028488.1 hypothetical protein [Aliarcobacter skirrowii]
MKKNFIIDEKETKKIILETLTKFFIFVCLFAIPPLILRLDIIIFNDFVSEMSLTEAFQLLFLTLTYGIFFYIAKKIANLRRASVLIASFFLVLFIRENDALLDTIYHGFWFPVALTVTFIAIIYFAFDYKNGFKQLAIYFKMPQMKLIILSIAFLLVFSRLFGMGSFWKMVMVDNYMYMVKSMIEEGTELLAYLFILYGTFNIYKSLLFLNKESEK